MTSKLPPEGQNLNEGNQLIYPGDKPPPLPEAATQEDAEKYLANWQLIRELEAEQKELGEKIKLAMIDGAEFDNGFHKLKLVETTSVKFDKVKFIERFGSEKYVTSSVLQVGLVKEHMTPAEYKALLEEGEVASTVAGSPALRVYSV